MATVFEGDSYKTPEKVKRALREYLLLGSRWSPYSFFIKVIFKYRALALKGLYTDDVWADSSRELMGYLESCGAKFDIRGIDNIKKLPGPMVFVANHMGTMETTILPGLICPIKPVTYVVKEKLVHGPIWGPIMRSRDPITVTRKDPRGDLEAVLSGGSERLAKGISIIIFPQGTRTEIFDRTKFNSLGIKLAAKAGVPIVPVALKTDYWSNGALLKGFGPVHRDRTVYIEFGEPMMIEGRGKAQHEACLDFIEGRLRQWGAKVMDPVVESVSR
uniref:1-acyl-sn-glycerol-3-phosphate acyltransferase n=1 Tax=Gracilinema caldarium TaxID=215591 RepID=A0A7C3EK19_9SPIR